MQLGLLAAALAGFALVVHDAAAPSGVALRRPPDQPVVTSEVGSVTSGVTRTKHHIVLVVDDPDLGRALQERNAAEALIHGEYGASSPSTTFEVIVAAPDDDLAALRAGLAEFEVACVSVACPAMRVIDVRAGSEGR